MSNQPSVLYIEDDQMSRIVMKFIFQNEMGLENVMIFENSENFMERVQAITPPPNIIFLDIHVAPHDGFQMLKMLRSSERFQKVPIIALTASVMHEEVQQLKTAGFAGCLAKPIDEEVFTALFPRIVNGEEVWRIVS